MKIEVYYHESPRKEGHHDAMIRISDILALSKSSDEERIVQCAALIILKKLEGLTMEDKLLLKTVFE